MQEQRGQRLYQSTCAQCHRADSSAPLNGPGLKGLYRKPYMPSGASANDERVADVIRMGRRMMPGYAHTLDDRQMEDLIAYLKTL